MNTIQLNRKITRSIRGGLRDLYAGKHTVSEEHRADLYRRTVEWSEKQLIASERTFRLRLSGMGKKLLELQCAKLDLPKDKTDETFTMMKFMFGDMIEALLITLMESFGIEIQSEQEIVNLKLSDDLTLSGMLDIVIDNKVYDIKTASPFSFEKFKKGLPALIKDDPFGYRSQLAAYARAGGYEVGGWIVVNKVNGEITVVDASDLDVDSHIEQIHNKALIVNATKDLSDVEGDIPFLYCEETNRRYLDPDYKWFRYKEALGWSDRLKWHYTSKKWLIK